MRREVKEKQKSKVCRIQYLTIGSTGTLKPSHPNSRSTPKPYSLYPYKKTSQPPPTWPKNYSCISSRILNPLCIS